MNSKKLSMGTKLGYGIGQVAISVPYNLVGVYLIFFFTDVAGVSPALAGTVFSIAVIWAAIADPFIGNFSDSLRTKYGRRRPLLLMVALPLAITTWLLFTAFDFDSEVSKNAYYIILAIIFYTIYTFTEVPFYSLGAEITDDYNERSRIRAVASMFVYVAVLIAVNVPTLISGKVVAAGGSLSTGWSAAAGICGVVVIIALLICWNSTRGRELIIATQEAGHAARAEKANIFKTFVETFKIKPVKYIVVANLFFLLGMSIVSASAVYMCNYVAHTTPAQQSIVMSVLPIATILWLPFINFMATKLGKKKAYISLVLVAGLACLLLFVAGVYNYITLGIFSAVFALGNGTFWTLCFAMAYDTTEVDEFVNGQRREGIMTAYMSLAQKVGTAASTLLTGIILEYIKYEAGAATQSEFTVNGLISLYTWIPAIFIVLSVISVCLYPITKSRYDALVKALEKKRAGEEYSTEGFEELL